MIDRSPTVQWNRLDDYELIVSYCLIHEDSYITKSSKYYDYSDPDYKDLENVIAHLEFFNSPSYSLIKLK
jgi:hypothetical protein